MGEQGSSLVCVCFDGLHGDEKESMCQVLYDFTCDHAARASLRLVVESIV